MQLKWSHCVCTLGCLLQVRMMTWSELLHRLVLVQGTTRLCAVRDLDELDIVGRIMRKENYLIGMLNAGVLGLYVKGLGPFGGRRFMLTKTLEWNLYLCILDPMFDEHFHIKQVSVFNLGCSGSFQDCGTYCCCTMRCSQTGSCATMGVCKRIQ